MVAEEKGLLIDVSEALPEVGSRKRFKGTLEVGVEGAYGISFTPGEGAVWEVELYRISGGIEVTGSIVCAVSLTCFRCLETFERTIEAGLCEHVLWAEGVTPESTDEYCVDQGNLDLEPIFRDAICMALPARRLCRPECRGMCPVCGADLNVETCECSGNKVDPRLAQLEELKRKLDEGP